MVLSDDDEEAAGSKLKKVKRLGSTRRKGNKATNSKSHKMSSSSDMDEENAEVS